MIAAEETRLEDARRDLRRTDQRAREYRLTAVAPAASMMRGKCAAMAPVTVQAAAKTNASRIMVRSIGMCGLTARRPPPWRP